MSNTVVQPDNTSTTEPRGWYTKDGRLRGSEQPIEGKCGAKLRGAEPPRYCTKDAHCWLHKGPRKTAGMAHGNYKHGLNSKYMPKGLRKKYQEAVEDPEWLSLQEEIATLKIRQMELIEQLGQEPPPWVELQKLFTAYQKDPKKAEHLIPILGAMINEGANALREYRKTWLALREVIQEITKVKDAESRRLKQLDSLVSAEQVVLLFRAFMLGIKETIDQRLDRETGRPILVELNQKALALLPP